MKHPKDLSNYRLGVLTQMYENEEYETDLSVVIPTVNIEDEWYYWIIMRNNCNSESLSMFRLVGENVYVQCSKA
jgi:hypothetical protein